MKIFLFVIIASFATTFCEEDYLLEMDEFSHLETENKIPDEAKHPEIDDGFEEALDVVEMEETEEIQVDEIEEPTFYEPTDSWDIWIEKHMVETILWAIIGLLLTTIIGLACCLFDISHLLFNLLRNEADMMIQLQPIPIQPPIHQVRFAV